MGRALGDATNFNNSLRERQICPFFPPCGKEMYVCAHVFRHVWFGASNTRRPQPGHHPATLAVAHGRPPGVQGSLRVLRHPNSWQRAGGPALVPRSVSVTSDPPGEAAEQRGVWESLATGKPGALEPASDPQGPQPPPLSTRQGREPTGHPAGCPRPVSLLSRHRLAPQPGPADRQTNEGTQPSSLCTDPPWSLGSSRGSEAFGDSPPHLPRPPPHPFPFQSRIRPLEILHTNKIVTNLHPRWGVSGSRCHGDHLQGPGYLRLSV